MNDKQLALDIVKYLEHQIEYGLYAEKSVVTDLINRIKDNINDDSHHEFCNCHELEQDPFASY
jgi:hypothetical protein